jgi:putative NADH dehydrogenase subunit 6
MNYLIGFIIFAGGLSILIDPAPSINIFGLPKGDVIPYGLNIPVGSVMALLGLLFIYREIKK